MTHEPYRYNRDGDFIGLTYKEWLTEDTAIGIIEEEILDQSADCHYSTIEDILFLHENEKHYPKDGRHLLLTQIYDALVRDLIKADPGDRLHDAYDDYVEQYDGNDYE